MPQPLSELRLRVEHLGHLTQIHLLDGIMRHWPTCSGSNTRVTTESARLRGCWRSECLSQCIQSLSIKCSEGSQL